MRVWVTGLFWVVLSTLGLAQTSYFDRSFKIKPATNFKLTSLNRGPITLSSYRGKVIVVNYFATWCPPCRKEFPDLIKLQSEMPQKVQVLAMSMDDTVEPVQSFIKSANFPVIFLGDSNVGVLGAIPGIPTTYFISPDFVIVDRKVGFLNYTELKRLVVALSKR